MTKRFISHDDEAPGTGLPEVVEEALNSTYVPSASTVGEMPGKADALLSFYAAAAKRTVAPVKIAMIADSIQEGDGVSDYYLRAQSVLADRLLAHWPIPSMVTQGAQWIGGWQENGQSHPAPMALTGVSGTDYTRTTLGLPRRSVTLRTYAAAWSMSAPRQMSSFDVVFHRNSSGGVANILVDGVSVGTYQTNSSTPAYSHRQHFEVTPGPHTITIKKDASATSASNVVVDAVITYETPQSYTKGFHVWDGAHSGYTVSDFLTGVGVSGDLTAIDPDLIVVSLGANDEEPIENISVDQFYAHLGTMIGFRDQCAKKPGIVLMPVWKRGNVPLASHVQYVAQQYRHVTADPRNCILDLNLRFPDIADGVNPTTDPLTYRGLYYDNVHPTDAGSALMADTLARFLAPPA